MTKPRVLITGGAGFIGVNAAEYFIKKGYRVSILDDLSRMGSNKNLSWLGRAYSGNFSFTKGDVTQDFPKLSRLADKADVILHLAAQTAVTTSVKDPRNDFSRNALGTLNILEATRRSKKRPLVIYSSTNKVYGGLEDLTVVEQKTRCAFKNLKTGVSESQSLDFHSPYGCSKGAADQYVRDYARIYDLDTVVLRQSCIYGPHQFGIEDQGWVAWFMIAALTGKPITIYGNGKQVRDILYISDLLDLYDLCIRNRKKVRGQIFNVGGGPDNTMSLLEFLPMLGKIKYSFDKVRPGDQPIYVSNISKAKKILGWRPRVGVKEGIAKIGKWVKENAKEF